MKKSRKALVNKLDSITAEIIKLRDVYACQKCGKTGVKSQRGKKFAFYGVHWAHIFGRRSYNLRWDLLNSLCLCAGCHRQWHENPLEAEKWFAEKFPARYNYLIEKRKKVIAIKDTDLMRILESHTEKLKQLREEFKTGELY